MCCVNGLPMQVGLNTLLRQGKPDRLLIEPTGLGHPRQILDILTAAVYEPWIDLRATLCILDPRQLLEEKIVANDNFRDQLAAADIIVANKSDRATPESEAAFANWWQQYGGERLQVTPPRVTSSSRCWISRAVTPPRCRQARTTCIVTGKSRVWRRKFAGTSTLASQR